jgi:hypothetical protein
MTTFLVIVLVVLMALVVISLVRGIIAFLQSHRADVDEGGQRQHDMQLLQNKMMFNRIKYQALAILVVALIMMIAR